MIHILKTDKDRRNVHQYSMCNNWTYYTQKVREMENTLVIHCTMYMYRTILND